MARVKQTRGKKRVRKSRNPLFSTGFCYNVYRVRKRWICVFDRWI